MSSLFGVSVSSPFGDCVHPFCGCVSSQVVVCIQPSGGCVSTGYVSSPVMAMSASPAHLAAVCPAHLVLCMSSPRCLWDNPV